MPELAEVEFFRHRWDEGMGERVLGVEVHPAARVFRGCHTALIRKMLRGSTLLGSRAHGKQMLFEFSGGGWLGLHLGMTGELRVEAPGTRAASHNHLVLRQRRRALVFADSRMFGRVRFDVSAGEPPRWWRELPPAILSAGFTADRVHRFLRRRARSPIKSVLLDQSVFPGIGNWMADEVLWRQRLHPLTPAGSLDSRGARALWREVRSVARRALVIVGTDWGEFPLSWLHRHRWGSGEVCPRCGAGLVREAAAGRTTCSCPRCQPAPTLARRGRAVAGGRRRERPGERAD